MKLPIAVVGLSVIAVGCAGARIRTAASEVLDCPSGKISLKEERPGTFVAEGCGRAAICQTPEEPGAEVQCAGGGSITRPTPPPAAPARPSDEAPVLPED